MKFRLMVEGKEIIVSAVYQVCGTCNGKGSHSHRFGAITASDREEWDEESFRDYIAGRYDEVCGECNGKRVIAVPDMNSLDKPTRRFLERWQKEEEEFEATSWAERRAENPRDFEGQYRYRSKSIWASAEFSETGQFAPAEEE
jgi:hypothetical protein